MKNFSLKKSTFAIALCGGADKKPVLNHVSGYHTWIVSDTGSSIHIGVDKRKGYWYITEISTGMSFGGGNGFKTRRDALASITDRQIDTIAAYLAKHPDLAIA